MKKVKFLFYRKYLMCLILFIFIIINFSCTKSNDTSDDLCSLEVINNYDIHIDNQIIGSNLVDTIYKVKLFLEEDQDCDLLRYIIKNDYFKDIIPDELKKVLNKTDVELILVYKKYKKDIKKYLKKWLKSTFKKEYIHLYPIELNKNYDTQKEAFYHDLDYNFEYIGLYSNNPFNILSTKNKWLKFYKVMAIGNPLPVIYLENLERDDRGYFYVKVPPKIAVKVKKDGDKDIWSFIGIAIKFEKFKEVELIYEIKGKTVVPICVGYITRVGIINVRKNSDSKFICEVIWEEDY